MDLGSPSRRGAIIRSSLIKLREMSKDSTMPRQDGQCGRRLLHPSVVLSSYPPRPPRPPCTCIYTCASSLSISFVRSLLSDPFLFQIHFQPWKLHASIRLATSRQPSDDTHFPPTQFKRNFLAVHCSPSTWKMSLSKCFRSIEYRTLSRCCKNGDFKQPETAEQRVRLPPRNRLAINFRWSVEGKRMPTDLSFSQESGQVF